MGEDLRALAAAPEDVARAALWHAARGEWERAHEVAQGSETREAAWVHAYLHRVEGDLENARYWYGRAGRAEATGGLEAEWEAIAAALGDGTPGDGTHAAGMPGDGTPGDGAVGG